MAKNDITSCAATELHGNKVLSGSNARLLAKIWDGAHALHGQYMRAVTHVHGDNCRCCTQEQRKYSRVVDTGPLRWEQSQRYRKTMATKQAIWQETHVKGDDVGLFGTGTGHLDGILHNL